MQILLLSREPEGSLLSRRLISLGLEVELQSTSDFITSINPDVVISHHYPFVIKGEKLQYIQKFVNFNVHNTYLPYGRGIYGIMWAAAMNCPQGFTFHGLEKRLDAGAILYRRKIEFPETYKLSQVWKEIEKTSIDFLVTEFEKIVLLYKERYYDKSIKGFIKTRKEANLLYELLPAGWDTTIGETREIFLSKIP